MFIMDKNIQSGRTKNRRHLVSAKLTVEKKS